MMPTLTFPPTVRLGLQVAVAAQDPVRRADLAARIALAGHTLATPAKAEIVVADGSTLATGGLPMLRLARIEDDMASVLPDDTASVLPDNTASVLPPDLTAIQLDAALRAVAAGLRVTLPEATVPGFAEAEPARPPLTPRELEILRALSEGLSNKAVARQLGISAHTVKFHLEAVFAKLGVASRAEAVAKGLRRGLILL